MHAKEFNEKLFEAMLTCFKELDKHKAHPNATQDVKNEAINIQVDILVALTPQGQGTLVPDNLKLSTVEKLRKAFIDSDFSSEELLEKITGLADQDGIADKVIAFSNKNDPSVVRRLGNFIANRVPLFKSMEVPVPEPIGITAKAGIKALQDLQKDLLAHMTELTFLEKEKVTEPPIKPFLTTEMPDSDASRLITTTAQLHVEECMKIHFAMLFEYAQSIELIRSKLNGGIKNFKTMEFLEKVQAQLLQELDIGRSDLDKLHTLPNLYAQKEAHYLQAKINPDDCLDTEHLFVDRQHIRKNMDRLFAVLDRNDSKNVALISSLQHGYEACEMNSDLMKHSLQNIRFMRDQAKNVTQKFDHPLLHLPRGAKVTLEHVISMFGVKGFIRKNFQEFNYKELSDLTRVRISLESQPLKMEKVEAQPLPAYDFVVDPGERKDFSYQMQTNQYENLKKYAPLCGQQMQMARILLSNLKTNDPVLANNLRDLQEVFNEITAQKTGKHYHYREITHRKLHACLDVVCNSFYANIEQSAMHLLLGAANIQAKVDYKMFANDVGNTLIANSAANAYGSKYEEAGMFEAGGATVQAWFIEGADWGDYSLAESVGNNAAQLVVGSSDTIKDDVTKLNYFAAVLNKSFTGHEKFDTHIQARDMELFKVTRNITVRSRVQRFLMFMGKILSVIAAVLACLVPRFNAEERKRHKEKAANAIEAFKSPAKAYARKQAKKIAKNTVKNQRARSFRERMAKQLMRVQLEQQVEVLAKSLQLASAMQLADIKEPIADMYAQKFGQKIRSGKGAVLSDDAKAYYKILALQEAVKTISDAAIREMLGQRVNRTDEQLQRMSLEEREKHISQASRDLAPYADFIKIDAFYNECKGQFEQNIGTKIDKATNMRLTTDGIAARETMKWLLATPVVLEATKALFMITPFINEVFRNFTKHFLYRASVLAKGVQSALYSASLIKDKSKELEIPGSVAKAAEYYIYDFGKMRLDLQCADKMLDILHHAPAFEAAEPEEEPGLMAKAYAYATTIAELPDNPYNQPRDTFLAAMQEQAAWQTVEVIKSILKYAAIVENRAAIEATLTQLRKNLNELNKPAIQKDDRARNKIMLETLPLFANVYQDYELQTDAKNFEFLMLLRYAAESVGTITKLSIQVQEYMSFHPSDVQKNNAGMVQSLLKSSGLGNYLYKSNVNMFSGGAIVSMNNALDQLQHQPKKLQYAKTKPVAEPKAKAKKIRRKN